MWWLARSGVQKDLAPLSGMMRSTLFIVSSPSGPLKTLKDIISYGNGKVGAGHQDGRHPAGALKSLRPVHLPPADAFSGRPVLQCSRQPTGSFGPTPHALAR
ncbi:MAG: hypothetical protein A3G27_15015 [Betaproteobacteria bacterium RIFCSPLOWO2_12_FULL_66_14]|nr:MAG: hypothetical protein A3G27_15015 [Betaproteobacteria bacterium RIFCSPLOWO2_12_FULL_66_14]